MLKVVSKDSYNYSSEFLKLFHTFIRVFHEYYYTNTTKQIHSPVVSPLRKFSFAGLFEQIPTYINIIKSVFNIIYSNLFLHLVD